MIKVQMIKMTKNYKLIETPEDQTPYALAYLGNDSKQMGISDVISMVFGAHNIYYTPVWYK
jgi:hypothetical protein